MKEIALAAGIVILGGYLAGRLIWAVLFGGIRDDISDGPARRDERGRGGQ